MSNTIDFNAIDKNFLLQNNFKSIKVFKNDITYYFKLSLKTNSDKMVVFSNGAIDRSKSTPPIFMRSSWHADINANCIFIDDPTIHNTNLSIGWGIGIPEVYYLEEISIIIKKIISTLNVINSDVIYYGSSAGGTMSILLAANQKGSIAITNNPQVRTDKFLTGKTIKDIHRSLFNDYIEEDFYLKFNKRISIPYALKQYGYVPEVYYILNKDSSGDYSRQYLSLQADMKYYNLLNENIEVIMYSDEKLGHNPIGKGETINILNSFIETEKFNTLYVPGYLESVKI